jgi:hypothetical protein
MRGAFNPVEELSLATFNLLVGREGFEPES